MWQYMLHAFPPEAVFPRISCLAPLPMSPPDFLRYSAKAGEGAHLGIGRGAGGTVCALAEPPKRAKRDGLEQRLRLVPDQVRHHLFQRTQLACKDMSLVIAENYSLYAPSQMASDRNRLEKIMRLKTHTLGDYYWVNNDRSTKRPHGEKPLLVRILILVAPSCGVCHSHTCQYCEACLRHLPAQAGCLTQVGAVC